MVSIVFTLTAIVVAFAACSSATDETPRPDVDVDPDPTTPAPTPTSPPAETPADADGGPDAKADAAKDALPDTDPPTACTWTRTGGGTPAVATGGKLVIDAPTPPSNEAITILEVGNAGPMSNVDLTLGITSFTAGEGAGFVFQLDCGLGQNMGGGFYVTEDGTVSAAVGIDTQSESIDAVNVAGITLRAMRSGASAEARIERNGVVLVKKVGTTSASPTATCRVSMFAMTGTKSPFRLELDDFAHSGIGGCVDDFSQAATY